MVEETKENWDKILFTSKKEHEMSNISCSTRLEPLRPHSFKDNTVAIVVPEQTLLQYANKKYGLSLKTIISELLEKECEVGFEVKEQTMETEESSAPQLTKNNKTSIDPNVIQSANLNPKYIFNTSAVGGDNDLVHATVLAMAESPGEIYNPLFTYEDVEFGKTHLMRAIVHFILKNNAKSEVLYVTSETFTSKLIDVIRNKNNIITMEFKGKYRNDDVLLIDGVQFIIGKKSTQEEFLHTFNTLYELKGQIIISSDKPSEEVGILEERLRSRFEWGLAVNIQSPGYEARMAILHKKEEMEGYNIDNEVIKCIATDIKPNARELEGALTRIVALLRLNKCDIILELAGETLRDIISPNAQRGVTPDLTVQMISDHLGLTPLDIPSQKRNKEIIYPGQIVMYLYRDMTATPLQTIGQYLGGRDHTIIVHNAGKIAGGMTKNDTLRNTMGILKKKINP